MQRRRLVTRLVPAAAIALGVAAIVVAQPATASTTAQPRTVTLDYYCSPTESLTVSWTITTPKTVRLGEPVPIEVSGDFGPNGSEFTIPAGSTTAELEITIGQPNGVNATVTATGLANPTDQPPGSRRVVTGGSASFTPVDAGYHTFFPGAVTGHGSGQTQTCTVIGVPPLASKTQVVF